MIRRTKTIFHRTAIAAVPAGLGPAIAVQAKEVALSDAEVENLVRRSYRDVAMYDVDDEFALKQGGRNTCDVDTRLQDHTRRE